MDDLRELYQEVILEHNRSARNFHPMQDADVSLEGYNPLCGDRYTVFVKKEGDRIEGLSFTGSGCAISKASASLMCSQLEGRSVIEAEELHELFSRLVKDDGPVASLEKLGSLAALGGVREFPMRIKCATLPWHTLRAALRGDRDTVSTE